MALQQPIKDFVEVRQAALEAFDKSKRASESTRLKIFMIVQLHYYLVVTGSFLGGVIIFVPPLGDLLSIGAFLSPSFARFSAFVVVLLVWGALFTRIAVFIRNRTDFQPLLRLISSSLIFPFILVCVKCQIDGLWADFTQDLLQYTFWSLFALFLSTVQVFTYFTPIPQIIYLFATSTRAGNGGQVFPSYESLTNQMIDEMRKASQQYTRLQITNIARVAHHKHAGLSVRTQTVGIVFAILALFSLLGLTFAQGDVANGLNSAYQRFIAFMGLGAQAREAPEGVFLVGFLLLCLVLCGLYYGATAYLEFRLLEAINIFCDLRLSQEDQAMLQASIVSTKPPATSLALGTSSQGSVLGLSAWTFFVVAMVYWILTRINRSRKQT